VVDWLVCERKWTGDFLGMNIDYYQGGYSIKEVAELVGLGRNRLARRWKELGLPVSRKVEERVWSPEVDEAQD